MVLALCKYVAGAGFRVGVGFDRLYLVWVLFLMSVFFWLFAIVCLGFIVCQFSGFVVLCW